MRKVAVTGGSGFVGRATIKRLHQLGIEVVDISRSQGRSILNSTQLLSAMAGCEAVIHCAGINREIGEQTYLKVHIEGTRNLVEAAKACGVKKLVYVSFLKARPNSKSEYHTTKWRAEEIIRNSGIEYTIIKPGVIYGKGDHMLDHLSHAFHTLPVFALVGLKNTQWVRPIAVREVSQILVTSIGDPRLANQTFAVLGPEQLLLSDAVKRVARVCKKRIFFFNMPILFHHVLAWLCERIMRVPLVAKAQVRILAEGVARKMDDSLDLPEDLRPAIAFSEAEIESGLPLPEKFSFRDLSINPCC